MKNIILTAAFTFLFSANPSFSQDLTIGDLVDLLKKKNTTAENSVFISGVTLMHSNQIIKAYKLGEPLFCPPEGVNFTGSDFSSALQEISKGDKTIRTMKYLDFPMVLYVALEKKFPCK